MAIRFQRSDWANANAASEILTIVRVSEEYHCDALGRATPFLVEVCAGPSVGDDFVGIFDLDGERVDVSEWEAADEAPVDVIEQIATGWETGTYSVRCLGAVAI